VFVWYNGFEPLALDTIRFVISPFALQVSIFSLLDDSKFEHFKPVMDAYIKGHFAAALVYK
jgi:hypothetical protein